MNILITGASGFVGYNLLYYLNKDSNLNLFVTSRKKNIDTFKNIKLFTVDISKEKNFKFLKDIDVVIHLAASQHYSGEKNNKNFYKETNIIGTNNLIRYAIKNKVKKFIYLSTLQVHGEFSEKGKPISESSKLNPRNEYAKSKLFAENKLIELCKISNMKFVILRCPLIYGGNVRGNIKILNFIINIGLPLPFKGMNNLKSYVDIKKVISFLYFCLNSIEVDNQIYLIKDEKDISLQGFVRRIIKDNNKKNILFYTPRFIIYFFLILIRKKNIYQKIYSYYQIDNSKLINCTSWKYNE